MHINTCDYCTVLSSEYVREHNVRRFYGNSTHTPSSRGGTMPAGKGGNKTAKMVAKGEKKGGLTTGLAKASDALSKP